jgi:pimeloyl-ACP methyl ester carboxylesterase
MPILERDGASIYYEVHGRGYPLVLFAPGGMNSVAQMWRESPAAPGQPMPWIDPRQVLSDRFTVVAMDQRNAGASTAGVGPDDGWATFAADHVALLDHLGFDRVHAMGGCIGSSYVLGLCQAAPGRVSAGVLQNPIGLSADNRDRFLGMFDGWASDLSARRDNIDAQALSAFRQNMFGGEFVFSVDRSFVGQCPVPLLVLSGHDEFHPPAVAEEIVEIAPDAKLIVDWAGPERYQSTGEQIREFLTAQTP